MSSILKIQNFYIFSLNFHQIPLDVSLGGTRDLSIADLVLANVLAKISEVTEIWHEYRSLSEKNMRALSRNI